MCTINVSVDTHKQLTELRDQNKYTSYWRTISALIDKHGIPKIKVGGNPFRSGHKWIAVPEIVLKKLEYIRHTGKLNCICNVINSLLGAEQNETKIY